MLMKKNTPRRSVHFEFAKNFYNALKGLHQKNATGLQKKYPFKSIRTYSRVLDHQLNRNAIGRACVPSLRLLRRSLLKATEIW
jgi:hypothetical protein